jgi:HK97 family phage major capsid protein
VASVPEPTESDLKDFVIRMRQAGLRPTSCNNRIRAVNSYLTWLGSKLKVPRMKEPHRVLPTFTPDDIHKLAHYKPRTLTKFRLQCIVLMKFCTRSFADYGEPESRVGFGEYVRAMVLGPRTEAERRALAEGTDSAGGYGVPDVLSRQLIDKMRAATTVVRAGARTVDLTSDITKIARLASDPAAAWRLENAAIAESDPTFEAVTFTARSLAVLVKASRELLEDSVNINEALMGAFAGSMGVELDRVSLIGSGTPPEPRGIKGTTNVGNVSMGDNGAALTNFDPFIDGCQKLWDANAGNPTAFIMPPRTFGKVAKLKDQQNNPLRKPDVIANIPFLSTTSLPINETQGTSNLSSRIILGDFSQLLIGVLSQLRIEVLRELFAGNHQYAFLAHLRADVQLAHPQSFAEIVGVL